MADQLEFSPFPKNKQGTIDRETIKRLFLDSHVESWEGFCREKNWNPVQTGLAGRSWEMEKRGKRLWEAVRVEAMDRSEKLETQTYLRMLRAVEQVPEGLLQLWNILAYHISMDAEDIKHDLELKKTGKPYDISKIKYRGGIKDIFIMSVAAKNLSDCLYRSLNLAEMSGDISERLKDRLKLKLIQAEEALAADQLNIEIMGSNDARASLKEAFEKYVDKPAQEIARDIADASLRENETNN